MYMIGPPVITTTTVEYIHRIWNTTALSAYFKLENGVVTRVPVDHVTNMITVRVKPSFRRIIQIHNLASLAFHIRTALASSIDHHLHATYDPSELATQVRMNNIKDMLMKFCEAEDFCFLFANRKYIIGDIIQSYANIYIPRQYLKSIVSGAFRDLCADALSASNATIREIEVAYKLTMAEHIIYREYLKSDGFFKQRKTKATLRVPRKSTVLSVRKENLKPKKMNHA
jgi:hypothetical protein